MTTLLRPHTLLAAFVALGMTLSAGLVEAQPFGRHQRAAQPQVTELAPAAGPAGTLVTIRGSGFTRQTAVRVGNRPVRLESQAADAISFRVPNGQRELPIVLRHPGMRDIAVGTFTVRPDPVFASVSRGPRQAGSPIDIRGSGFAPGDAVLLNGTSLSIVRLSPTAIVATLPADARSGALTFVRASTGQRWNTDLRVEIAPPPAAITSMQPSSGAPGTRVRLAVTHLTNASRIYFGNTELPTLASGRGWVEVAIPANARRSASFSVRGPNGASTFAQPFELVHPPTIAGMSSRPVAGGIEITLTGQNFGPDARIMVGNTQARILSSSPTRVVALLPHRAFADAPAVLHTRGQSVSTVDFVRRTMRG